MILLIPGACYKDDPTPPNEELSFLLSPPLKGFPVECCFYPVIMD